jgi:hypothetical protein
MADAQHDQNGKPTITCALQTDGTTVVKVNIDPTSHAVKVDDNITGSDNGNNGGNAMIDGNGVPVWTALSSAGDGSLVEVYATSDGKILIDSA